MIGDQLGYLHPKVGGFGAACYYNETQATQHSGPCKLCSESALLEGTLSYISPTKMMSALKREYLSFPTDDLWSMGKILLQMVHRSKSEVKTDLEEDDEMLHDHYGNVETMRTALVGKNLLSEKMKSSPPLVGKPALQKLLEFLLCSGCPDQAGKGPEATQKAIDLTKRWLEQEVDGGKAALNRINVPRVGEAAPECRNLEIEEESQPED